ncbi:Ppx/GppA phosphatase family protein [Paenibacillus sp. YPG26]|uniref:Ppx/GppA phosphatase family protein n=1 Tax=Paenibacillus sp. YPG26 TaxID=2878915 RepID=UPI002040838E|nr:Ppx/GppA phosphatase family protein [Paenibacillus sp. YPG26]USB34336.1 Ppx/GppA family phosphatase [Paenibacillus sp. YPG26]
MHMNDKRSTVGIIDIGSNSIRVVVYEVTSSGDYRVVHESKESARLSEKISADGRMEHEGILSIVPVLSEFRNICQSYECGRIRVAATAAIRNAVNADEIVDTLSKHTGLSIEVLSGTEEALYGFLGVAQGIGVSDGFIIDIGGGSTEITLFRNRELLHSVSLPFGAVNANYKFSTSSGWTSLSSLGLIQELRELMRQHDWISNHPGLPLIGLGGTIRSLGKLDQRRNKYPLPMTHHYVLEEDSVNYYAEHLPSIPVDQRRRLPGLSKNRVDLIVPGVLILHTIFSCIKAKYCLISGTGLREGLLHDVLKTRLPEASEVVDRQVRSLLSFQSAVSPRHLNHVHQLSVQLLNELNPAMDEALAGRILHVSAMLYKIGASLWYHQYEKHTFYWLLNAPLGGLTHREIVLIALIAEFRAKNGKQTSAEVYQNSILKEEDTKLTARLAALLQVAIALDASETQPVTSIIAKKENKTLTLKLNCRSQPFIELRELDAAAKVFQKAWDIKLKWEIQTSSRY